MTTREAKIYATRDSDLAAYLICEGITLQECVKDEHNPRVVWMHFLDPLGKCRDLELVFIRSPFKQYRDTQKQLLARIHEALRS